MVTKGIIMSVPKGEEDNIYEVRLPFFEDPIENAEEIIYESVLNEAPGILQGYNVGDVVYCAFEDNNMARPVIIGKLFSTSLENMGAEIQTLDLDVTKRASLPIHTTIGNATEEDISNISEIKNKVSKSGDKIFGLLTLGNNTEFTSKKKINIINNSGTTIMSELTDHLFADSMTRQCTSGTNGSDDNVGYIHLCDITLTKHYQARFIDFRIYVGDGNNGRTNQNAYIELLLQSGWSGSDNGRFGGYWELHKLGTSFTSSKFDIVVTSDSNLQYSVWLYVNGVGYCKPTYTVWYDREINNDPTNICTITHVGNVRQATAPTGTDPNCNIGHGDSTSVDHANSADNDGDGNTISSYYCTLSTAQTVSGKKTFTSEVAMTASGASDICSGVLAAFKTNRAQVTNLITNNIYTGGTSGQNPITFNKYTAVSDQVPSTTVQLAKIDTDGTIYEGTTKLSDKYVQKSGSTMTGTLTLLANQYSDSYTGALNCNNSNIYGVNSIYTADASDDSKEGIHFYNTATTVDTIYAKSGVLYFTPNRTLNSVGTSYKVYHSGNITYGTVTPSGGSDGDIYIQYTT